MQSEPEHRFYTRNLDVCPRKCAFIGVERIYHWEIVGKAKFTKRIERRGWLVSNPHDVKEFKNRTELNKWMTEVSGAPI